MSAFQMEEPAERTLTGEPVSWSSTLRLEWGIGIGPYVLRRLRGVTWTCPRCGHQSVELRQRARTQYWFQCTRALCTWKLEFNHVVAERIATSLGAGPARRSPPSEREKRAAETVARLIDEERTSRGE